MHFKHGYATWITFTNNNYNNDKKSILSESTHCQVCKLKFHHNYTTMTTIYYYLILSLFISSIKILEQARASGKTMTTSFFRWDAPGADKNKAIECIMNVFIFFHNTPLYTLIGQFFHFFFVFWFFQCLKLNSLSLMYVWACVDAWFTLN